MSAISTNKKSKLAFFFCIIKYRRKLFWVFPKSYTAEIQNS